MSHSYQKQINQSGEALLKAIGSLTQITKIHLNNNELLQEGVLKFIRLIETLGQGSSEVTIHLSEGRFYYQEQKLFMRPANAKLFNQMLRFFEDRNLFGFTFNPDLKDITNPDGLIEKQATVKRTYANVMSSVKEVARKLSSNQGAGLRNSVRLV